MSDRTDNPFGEAGLKMLRDAALRLVLSAPPLVDGDPQLATVVLILAAAHAASFIKMPYDDLVKLMSDHYESVLKQEFEVELLKASGWVVKKPEGKV